MMRKTVPRSANAAINGVKVTCGLYGARKFLLREHVAYSSTSRGGGAGDGASGDWPHEDRTMGTPRMAAKRWASVNIAADHIAV